MQALIHSCFYSLHKNAREFSLRVTKLNLVILFTLLFFSSKSFGQSGDLSQLRNGNGKTKNGVTDTCGSCWVNGNAGASNAHYTEGMSIAYRSLITGLTKGQCYEYELGYDTYHGAMAIDFLTHFQRLQPHQPFGHNAEVVNPLAMLSGSTPYTMTVVPKPGEIESPDINTFAIPAPQPSGILSGAFDKNGNPLDISQQPVTVFNALPAAQREMTIYNGNILGIKYVSQAPVTIGGADAETRIRVAFIADDDSVLLAWGGHIASRTNWGYTKDSKGKLIPLSAGGISGSPYHMRQKAMDIIDCSSKLVTGPVTGFGNQDRSLSAAAVIPEPECPTVPSQAICANGTFSTFSISNPDAGTTYVWSFGSNSANAVFSGSTTGTSVTVVAGAGGFTAGSFTLNITATLNSIAKLCENVATGTVNPLPTADAGNAPDAQCYDEANGNTFNLDGASTNGNPSWAVKTNASGLTVEITNGNTDDPTVKITGGTGSVTLELTVTSNQNPPCGDATDEVTVTVNAQPDEPNVKYNAPGCDETTFSVTINSPVSGATYSIKDKCGSTISGVKVGDTETGTYVAGSSDFSFSNIPAGSGYQITVTTTGNCSATLTCGTCPSSLTARSSSTTQVTGIIEPVNTLSVKAYPNPFRNQVRFEVSSPVEGKGVLEVYNLLGQKVKTVHSGRIAAGRSNFDVSLPGSQNTSLFYVLKVDGNQVNGKLIRFQ